jgi:hypothetical protein
VAALHNHDDNNSNNNSALVVAALRTIFLLRIVKVCKDFNAI